MTAPARTTAERARKLAEVYCEIADAAAKRGVTITALESGNVRIEGRVDDGKAKAADWGSAR